MSAEGAVMAGRSAAEARMADTFTAYSPNGTTTDADDLVVPAFASEGTTPGKVQGRSSQGTTITRMVNVGGVDRPVIEGGLHIPYAAPLPEIKWEYECVAVGDPINSFRVGRRWRVENVPLDDATARRLDVVQVA